MVSPGGDMSHVRPVYPLSHDNAPLCVLRHIIQPLYCFIKPYVLQMSFLVVLWSVLQSVQNLRSVPDDVLTWFSPPGPDMGRSALWKT